MTDIFIKRIKAALSGAALGVATMETARGENLTPNVVNKWSRRLNRWARWLIAIYFLSILAMGFTASSADKMKSDEFYSLMTPAEKNDFKERFETGRIGPISSESNCQNSKQFKQK